MSASPTDPADQVLEQLARDAELEKVRELDRLGKEIGRAVALRDHQRVVDLFHLQTNLIASGFPPGSPCRRVLYRTMGFPDPAEAV